MLHHLLSFIVLGYNQDVINWLQSAAKAVASYSAHLQQQAGCAMGYPGC